VRRLLITRIKQRNTDRFVPARTSPNAELTHKAQRVHPQFPSHPLPFSMERISCWNPHVL
jgi:hypothetical protein